MKRRTFTKLAATPFAFAGALGADPERKAAAAGSAKMKLGNQNWSDDASLTVLAALGVDHICSALPSRKFDENWSVDGLTRLRERVESYTESLWRQYRFPSAPPISPKRKIRTSYWAGAPSAIARSITSAP